MKRNRLVFLLLLFSVLTATGCLERRLFIRWDGHNPPEMALYWSGDSADALSGELPNYSGNNWAFHSPQKTKDDKDGSFMQTGIWVGPKLGGVRQPIDEPSPITPELSFHTYYFGVLQLHTVSGEVPGSSMLPFSDPEQAIPKNPVDSLKKAKFPLTAETQEHIEKEYDRMLLKFYQLIVSETLLRIHDSLYPGDSVKGKLWSDTLATRWYNRLRLDEPASNDLDFFKYLQDSVLPIALPPDKVMQGLAVSKSIKQVHDTYRDLEDEKLIVSLKLSGKEISNNSDSTSADTLIWSWEGKQLRDGGPFSISARSITWDPVGCLIITILLMIIPLYRLSRRRNRMA